MNAIERLKAEMAALDVRTSEREAMIQSHEQAQDLINETIESARNRIAKSEAISNRVQAKIVNRSDSGQPRIKIRLN